MGAGLMGCGIASKFALAGFDVIVHDADTTVLDEVVRNTDALFAEMATAKVILRAQAAAAASKVRIARSIEEVGKAALVVEAIFESASTKQSLFRALEDVISDAAIIASSTSGIVPETLSEFLSRPERFLVAHFWNPPHIVPLVEVVPAPRTTHETVTATMDWLRAANCKPVLLSKAVPGFIGNRLQSAVLREALHLLQAGVADAATIDEVMKESLGRRYRWFGPLEGADLGGLDTFLTISTQLLPQLASGEEMLGVLRQLVGEGNRGRRNGRGIYDWNEERESRLSQSRLRMLADGLGP